MNPTCQRVVVDADFERAVGALSRVAREEGLQVLARIDVRDHLWRELGHDFRRCLLIEAWSPELALEAFRHDLDVAAVLPTTFAVYELADGETAVVAKGPASALAAEPDQHREPEALLAIANREAERARRVLRRLEAEESSGTPVWAAA